ncbi:GreA/GreB family elongation factor [Paraburkholderia oxyphila]|uniref:hypothetical protein n=1 Tax=Paraburkholderia oxyphila TaxID=614212 RepID=UPI0012EE77E1|nr:hypothetical protein [Paraburkholderia oxyphila]
MVSLDDLAAYGVELVKADASELQLRNGTGRLYYVAFHLCDRAGEEHCNPLPTQEGKDKGMHERAYLRLEGHCKEPAISNSRLKTICQKARDMRELRTRADYHLDENFEYDDAREAQQLLFLIRREFKEVQRQLDSAKKKLSQSPEVK